MASKTNPPMVVGSGDAGPARVNRPFSETLGLTNAEFGAKPLLAWIHPDDRDALKAALDSGEGRVPAHIKSREGDWIRFDFQVRTRDGAAVFLGQLHFDSDTADPLVATNPSPGQTALQESLEVMARIVEAKNPGMRCSILLVDPETECVAVGAGPSLPAEYNAAVAGLRIGPMVGSCGTASFWNVPVVVENIFEDPLWVELREAATIAGVSACWSHPITTTDGSVLGAMALYNAEPCAPAKHHMDGLEIAARMVGLAVERSRLEDQLRQANKMEAIGVLAGGIAHDFNNLLVTVLGNAELALDTLSPEAEATELLGDIVTAGQSASELCDQILGYAGKRASATEPLDCNALVEEMRGLSQITLSKKAELIYDLDDEPLGLLGDRSQLRQVIMNLMTNASEAIGNNCGRIVIGTRAETCSREALRLRDPDSELAPGDYVRLWVSDTGMGMSTAIQAKIFDPFFTTKPTGRGLGLAAVLGIIRAHKGLLTLDSEEGTGTTFSVLLPRTTAPPPAVQLPKQGPVPDRALILVVDDEPMVRKVLTRALEAAGHGVLCAADGREGVDVFRREADSIDCVLLDLSMPKLDGEEVFRELRKIRSDVRVILCSGYAKEEIIERFQGAELAGFLTKPYRDHELRETVAAALLQTKS